MNNSLYLRRKSKIYIEQSNYSLPPEYLFNLIKNIEGIGYTFSHELLDIVSTLSTEKLQVFYKKLISDLQENIGASVTFKPMYPNFPEQVVKASEKELYSNAIFHYLGDWIGERLLPNYQKKERPKLPEKTTLRIIDLGTKEDFNSIFTKLISSKTSISETDKGDIEWFVKNYNYNIIKYLPDETPFKENVAFLLGCMLKNNIVISRLFEKHIKTATDVLRVATALSDGDISLAENTKFKNISKRHRRLLLQCLENCGSITEDMLRFKNQWKRLGERLHPFEYKNKYPKCFESFDVIRNDKPFQTYNGKVENALLTKDLTTALSLLRTRPGEFARRLDKLLRSSDSPQMILEDFRSVSHSVSAPVLLQLLNYFKQRNSNAELRTFFPKGNVAKVKAIDNLLPNLNVWICNEMVSIIEKTLISKFKSYKQLGTVYLDEDLKNYTIPFALRSASKSLVTIGRGSKLQLPPGNTIRFFIYWKDGKSRTDLDLSALALDSDSNHHTTIAYYNLKELGGYHSGDITSAPDGASEFIDIEISNFLEKNIRYVLMSVNSFTSQPYCDLPICFAGFMMRQFPNSGEIYDPKTVSNKFDLTANTRIAIPLIIDLLERKVIWTDLSLKNTPSASNNVHNNLSSLTILNKSMTTLSKPNLFDLFLLHTTARGERTLDINNANTIFAVDFGIKPTDIDVIISEYL